MSDNHMTEEKALALMEEGFHCSQVVFGHLAGRLGFDEALARRLTAGLGAGFCHGDTCGAVAGAVLALGLVQGFDKPDADTDAALFAAVRELEKVFEEVHGSLLCRELLGGFDRADLSAVSGEHTYDNCPAYCTLAYALAEKRLGL